MFAVIGSFMGSGSVSLPSAEDRRRFVRITVGICLPVTLAFSLANLVWDGFPLLGLIEAALAIGLLPPAIWLSRTDHSIRQAEILVLIYGVCISFALSVLGAKGGSGMLWVFFYPMLAFMLVGQTQGLKWCVVWGVFVVCGLLIAPYVPFGYVYSKIFVLQVTWAILFYIGAAMSFNYSRTRFEERLQNRLQSKTERAQAYLERLRYVATHDTLTGLPNRTRMYEILANELADTRSSKEVMVVVYIKLERMFEISNVLGTEGSDELVRSIASSLNSAIGARGILARTGRDEFVCAHQTTQRNFDEDEMVRVVRDFQLSYQVAGYPIHIEHTLGIAVFPDHATDAVELMRKAEQAMFQAKTQQSDFSVYDEALDQRFVRRHLLFGQLRKALHDGALQLHYQAQVDMHSGTVVGAEAMARWCDSREGWIAPGEFIPVAENSGLIKPFTSWMLRTAFKQVKLWRKEGMELSLSVNISARSLLDPDFVSELENLSTQYQVQPHWIVLELTESCFAEFPDLAMRTIASLHDLGFKQSIDDFGTGYSSLSYLKDLKVDELKIDQSFVRDLDRSQGSEAIVRSTIQLAHNLGMSVVAEGIERGEIGERLHTMGCDVGQGYLYARPIPSDQFLKWVEAWSVDGPRTGKLGVRAAAMHMYQ